MTWRIMPAVGLFAVLGAGCVSADIHKQTVLALDESRRASAQLAAACEASKEEAADEIRSFSQEQARLSRELVTTEYSLNQAQTDLESTRYHLAKDRDLRRQIERQFTKLTRDYEQLERASKDAQWERTLLQTRVEDLAGILDVVQQELTYRREAGAEAQVRITVLEHERSRLKNQLISAQSAANRNELALKATRGDLVGAQHRRLEAESKLARLQNKKQQLELLDGEMRRERGLLESKIETLAGELTNASGELATNKHSLVQSKSRVKRLEGEKERAMTALTKAQKQAKMLRASLAAEQEIWSRLQEVLKNSGSPLRRGLK